MTDYDDRLEAYAETAASALPPGAFWQGFRDYDGTGRELLRAKAQTWLDVDLAAERLVAEIQPARASEMLADHETQVGLPDCCFQTLNVNIEDRRNAVLTRYRAQGGQSPEYFIDLAKSLGYDVTITENRPFVCGLSEIGGDSSGAAPVTRFDTIGADRFSWKVVVPEPRVTWFRCGSGVLGQDALATINRADDLECLLARYQPAQQDLTVSYRGIPEPIIDIDLRNGLPAGWQFTRNSFASYVNASGEIARAGIDELRVQHDPVLLKKLGGVISGSCENRFKYSNDFTQSNWVKQGVTITPNAAIGPDGELSADKMVTVAGTSNGIYQIPSPYIADDAYVFYVIAAPGELDNIALSWNSSSIAAQWDLATGTKVSGISTSGITPIGLGFYLCWITATRSSTTQGVLIRFGDGNGVAGDGISGIYLWNAGFAPGSFIQDIIKTGALGVVQDADSLKIPLSNVAGWQDGAPFEFTVSGWTAEGIGSTSQCLVSLDDGTTSPAIQVFRASNNTIGIYVTNGSTQALFYSLPVPGKCHIEITAHIETNNFWFSMSVDGGEAVIYGPDVSGIIPTGLTTIVLGDRSDGLRTLFGEIEKFKLRFLSTPA
jgi:uncharacterized protein YmfQ (DUF2313 family)